MLARRPRSERDVRKRLAERRFEQDDIDRAVGKLRAIGAIDDAAFAQAYVDARSHASPRSRRLLVRELRAAGVDPALATSAVAECSDAEAAYAAAARWAPRMAALEYEAFRDRLGSYLHRRGFGWQVAAATVARCWRELREAARAEA